MRKILVLLLALSFVLAAFAGCVTSSDKNKPDNGTKAPGGTNDSTVTLEPDIPYDLPLTDFNKEELTILAMDGKKWQLFEWQSNADILNQAIVQRNDVVEKNLNCTIEYSLTDHNTQAFTTAVIADVMTQSGEYDLVFTATGDRADTKGYYTNLREMDEIAFEQPFYATEINDMCTINGVLYGVIGYGSINYMETTSAIVYNKDMYGNMFQDSLYSYVDDMSWTLETMQTMAAAARYDSNGDGTISIDTVGDRFGLILTKAGGDNFFFGQGASFMPIGEDGVPVYNFMAEHNINIFTKMLGFMDHDWIYYKDGYLNVRDAFLKEQVLFGCHNFASIKMIKYAGTSIDYGVIPYPLYDTNQKEYISTMSLCEDFGILTSAPDIEKAAIALNAFNYYTYVYVKPSYFDALLKLQVAQDPDASRMIDLIMGRVTYDFAYIYNKELGGHTTYAFTMAKDGKNEYASHYRNSQQLIMGFLTTLVENYGTVEETE